MAAHDSAPTSEESEDTVLEDVAEEATPDDPLAVDNFPLSAAVKAALKEKKITSLFDIQAQTLSHVLAGKDLLGRARQAHNLQPTAVQISKASACISPDLA